MLKEISTTVTLSKVLLSKEFLRMYSTAIPLCLWILLANCNYLLSLTLFQAQEIVSWLLNLSKIPSQPRTIKSWSLLILNDFISGSAITTFGFPPYLESLASASPKVLDTESRPGKTLRGPTMISFLEGLALSIFWAVVLW